MDWVEEASLESFPASDPPSWVTAEGRCYASGVGTVDRSIRKSDESVLHIRQLIPPSSCVIVRGGLSRPGIFKQKQNIEIAFLAGADLSGRSIKGFLGEAVLIAPGLSWRGVFVTDRYGEIWREWIVDGHEFPLIEQILSSLNLVEIACEACEVPFWPPSRSDLSGIVGTKDAMHAGTLLIARHSEA